MKNARCGPSWRVALLGFALVAGSQALAKQLAPGKIIDKVTCRADGGQSYALFLPSSYSAQRRWPILYALDAGARGRLPVERFRDAAEQYGYIVAGSNTSRNGPPEIITAAVRAMLDDTGSRLSIDDRRIYFAGFSGGARAAVGVASASRGQVVGVIGCGAGFPEQLKPTASLPFVYFGTTGIEDFNFMEMKHLDRTLDGVGIAHRLAIFPGAHDWPPKEVCVRAIAWMELRAMRSGIQEKQEPLVEALFQQAVRQAASDESSGRPYDAFLEYQALSRDFSGLRDVAEYQRKAHQLKDSKAVQQALRQERDEEESQNRWMARLMRLKQSYAGAENPVQVTQDLAEAIADLGKRADGKEASVDRVIARRVQGQFLVELTQEAANDVETKSYAAAAFNLSLAVQIRPERPRLFYNLACAYALGGRKREALGALRRAIEKGFADLELLETDPDLDGIRKESGFQQILEGLKKKRPVAEG